jgi:SEC-C motif-containing protein
LAGFGRSLRASWRPVLLRFALAYGLLALGWLVLAPAYAHLLASLGRPLIPVLESTPRSTYTVERARVVAVRRVPEPGGERVMLLAQELWRGYANYDLVLLAALILATPGWSLRQRSRLLGLGLGLLTLAEIAFFLVAIEATQLQAVGGRGGAVRFPGFSRPRQVLFTWLYYFFQIMGRGLFPLLIYWGMIAIAWRPPGQHGAERAVGRNAPCPCGSGEKYKRCCGI